MSFPAALIQEYRDLQARARRLVEGLDPADFRRVPPGGGWSMAECVAHLNVAAAHYLPVLSATIEDGRQRGIRTERPAGYGVIGSLFIRFIEPPPRFRSRAPEVFRPVDAGDLQDVVETFLEHQEALVSLLERATGLDPRRLPITSPVSDRIRFRLHAAFAFLAAHERRHLWQAEGVRRRLGTGS